MAVSIRAAQQPTVSSDLGRLTDADLTRATDRAWREASRCWAEYRREPGSSPIKALLLTSTDAAEAWFEQLRDELDLRSGHPMSDQPVEVLTADRYAVVATPAAH